MSTPPRAPLRTPIAERTPFQTTRRRASTISWWGSLYAPFSCGGSWPSSSAEGSYQAWAEASSSHPPASRIASDLSASAVPCQSQARSSGAFGLACGSGTRPIFATSRCGYDFFPFRFAADFLPPRFDAPGELAIVAAPSLDIPLPRRPSYCFAFLTLPCFLAGIGSSPPVAPFRTSHRGAAPRPPPRVATLGSPSHALVVVGVEAGAVLVVAPAAVRIELGRVLDLVLRHDHANLLPVQVDLLDRPGRDHDLTAEDPRTRVDHHGRTPHLVGQLVA